VKNAAIAVSTDFLGNLGRPVVMVRLGKPKSGCYKWLLLIVLS